MQFGSGTPIQPIPYGLTGWQWMTLLQLAGGRAPSPTQIAFVRSMP